MLPSWLGRRICPPPFPTSIDVFGVEAPSETDPDASAAYGYGKFQKYAVAGACLEKLLICKSAENELNQTRPVVVVNLLITVLLVDYDILVH